MGDGGVVGRIVPWPCRSVHGPGEAGLFLWKGVFVEPRRCVFFGWLNNSED